MFRITSKTKMPLILSSSSDDEKAAEADEKSPVLCSAHENNGYFSIFSERQCDYPIRFGSGSFAFHYQSDEILVHFHPMFLWRYIHIQKATRQLTSQTDYVRMLTIASFHLRDNIQLTIRKNNIQCGSRQIPHEDFPIAIGAFNQLYRALIREYDATQFLSEMLDVCFKSYLLVALKMD